jgi:hypothetical protein
MNNQKKTFTAILYILIASLGFSGCKEDQQLTEEYASSSAAHPEATSAAAGINAVADFTIAVIPDTQHYMAGYFGGVEAMFTAQINWIKNNKTAQNIVYVAGLGDVVEHGDKIETSTSCQGCPYNGPAEWIKAKNGYYSMEASNIPYGLAVGNHDQTPVNTAILSATTDGYNQYFGRSHFAGRGYYGGNKDGATSNKNNSHYDYFSAGGKDFIVIYIEYDHLNEQSTDLNDWAYDLCVLHSSRKAIIVTHYAILTGDPAGWGTQGYRIWNRLKGLQNVFMILGGHVSGDSPAYIGEGYREDTYGGYTIRTYLSDYQQRAGGGNGRLRLMKFSVDNDDVTVKTYSPYAPAAYETDINSQFTKPLFGTTPTAQVINGTYKIIAKHSGQALVVKDALNDNGTAIVQWTYAANGVDNDLWTFTQIGTSGYYRITNVKSGKDMNVAGTSTEVGGLIVQYPYNAAAPYNDEWALIPIGGGYHKIIARHSGLCLNVAGGNNTLGAPVKQWTYLGTDGIDNDKFQVLVP